MTDKNKYNYYLSVCFGFLSILAKPMALSLPIILLLLDWYHIKKITKQEFLNKIPFALIIFPIAWITYQSNARIVPMEFPQSALIWMWSATFYLKKFLTPFVLLPLYQLPQPVSIFNFSYLSSVLILIATPFVMYWLRKDRIFILACLYFFGSTFFLWRYDNSVDVTIVADRFMYLPSLGFCLWLGFQASYQLKKSENLKYIFSGILIGLAFLTFRQSGIWKNDLTLWQHELKYERSSALVYNSYGAALSRNNQNDLALNSINKALSINPSYALAFFNRGYILMKKGNLNAAMDNFNTALSLNSKHVQSLIQRGILFSRLGNFPNALKDLNAAQELAPKNASIYNNRGIVLMKTGRFTEALKEYTTALEINPRLANAYLNRAKVQQLLKNNSQALSDLKIAQNLGITINETEFLKPNLNQ